MDIPETAFNLPKILREQVKAAREIGLYTDESELIADAVRTLLAARPDVRLATACRLYERDIISLGKAAELTGLDLVSFKRALGERGILRVAHESRAEIEDMALASLQAAGRSA